MIKLSTVATDIMGVSARARIDALIAGERDPRVLANRGLKSVGRRDKSDLIPKVGVCGGREALGGA
jgi:hypothetical protein